jgi:hypothetical protein
MVSELAGDKSAPSGRGFPPTPELAAATCVAEASVCDLPAFRPFTLSATDVNGAKGEVADGVSPDNGDAPDANNAVAVSVGDAAGFAFKFSPNVLGAASPPSADESPPFASAAGSLDAG